MAQLIKALRGQHHFKQFLETIEPPHLSHALLFTGPSGIGKKKAAWALAQILLCSQSDLSCRECPSCLQVEKQQHLSVLSITPETLEIKIQSVRQIWDFLSLQSLAPARIIIIDSAHQMNLQAANSLLKILEEPPANVHFILIAPHSSSVIPTIRSRTQVVRFTPLDIKDIPQTEQTKPWMVHACQGRMDLLKELEEQSELREQAFHLLHNTLAPQGVLCSMNKLTDLVRDRKQALFVCLCWQQIIRDAIMVKLQSHNLIHSDQASLIDTLKKISLEQLNIFFDRTKQMETDLKRYLNSVFLFDRFMLQMKHDLQQKQS